MKKLLRMKGPESEEQKLYKVLMTDTYRKGHYQWKDLGEGVESLAYNVRGWWKQRFLLDHNEKVAREIMTEGLYWSHFDMGDIDWDSLKKLPEEAINHAKSLCANFPSFVGGYKNGIATVSWQLIPDGRYYMDDDGFGITSDEETPVYAMVDKKLRVLVKFRFIEDYTQLEKMYKEAENILKSKLIP